MTIIDYRHGLNAVHRVASDQNIDQVRFGVQRVPHQLDDRVDGSVAMSQAQDVVGFRLDVQPPHAHGWSLPHRTGRSLDFSVRVGVRRWPGRGAARRLQGCTRYFDPKKSRAIPLQCNGFDQRGSLVRA